MTLFFEFMFFHISIAQWVVDYQYVLYKYFIHSFYDLFVLVFALFIVV